MVVVLKINLLWLTYQTQSGLVSIAYCILLLLSYNFSNHCLELTSELNLQYNYFTLVERHFRSRNNWLGVNCKDELITRTTNFWPKNIKFLLYNLQIFTLFWPIHFLPLQLQNNSAQGVEVNPEAYSCTLSFEITKISLFNFGDDILVSTLITTVESEHHTAKKIIKLKY